MFADAFSVAFVSAALEACLRQSGFEPSSPGGQGGLAPVDLSRSVKRRLAMAVSERVDEFRPNLVRNASTRALRRAVAWSSRD